MTDTGSQCAQLMRESPRRGVRALDLAAGGRHGARLVADLVDDEARVRSTAIILQGRKT